MSRHIPERPFGRCDTEQTVVVLKAGLAASGLDVLHVDGLNINGRDCVVLAMMYGVRPNDQGQRIVHDRDNGGAPVNLGEKTAADIRNMCADHIMTVWNAENTWDRAELHMHVQYEARAYLNMPHAPAEAVRDACCNAIRGVGVAPMPVSENHVVAPADLRRSCMESVPFMLIRLRFCILASGSWHVVSASRLHFLIL
jgi:hypothetical protein